MSCDARSCTSNEEQGNSVKPVHVTHQMIYFHFEQAIEFLSRAEAFRSHAVHFAIALFKMHVILLPESIQAQLCKYSDLKDDEINF